MSALTAMRSGQRAAERLMTDTWVVTRMVGESLSEETGQLTPSFTTVYTGPGKLGGFDAYERTPEAGAHEYTEMRPRLDLPISHAASANVQVDDLATCTASVSDPALVGSSVRIASGAPRTFRTARRFLVAEMLPHDDGGLGS